jgi:hypothetical protein
LPAVIVKTLKSVKIKEESVFDDRALRDEWSRAVIAEELPGLLGSCGLKTVEVQIISPARTIIIFPLKPAKTRIQIGYFSSARK